jgi:excisionase family DNA binding protein
MKFTKDINQADDAQPPISKPVPMVPRDQALPDDSDHLADLSGVARRLGVSKRFVQTLVRRKAIPVIRLGRRCTRFDLDSVLDAVKKFEVHEVR